MRIAKQFIWPSPDQAEANREDLERDIETHLAGYEVEYGFPSDQIEGKLTSGELHPSLGAELWLMAFDTLKRLRGAESP